MSQIRDTVEKIAGKRAIAYMAEAASFYRHIVETRGHIAARRWFDEQKEMIERGEDPQWIKNVDVRLAAEAKNHAA